ncbi:hypothetical protein CTI12_AA172740 [Artemisia annua]|uniref:Uncharacterized protein n=1 Tax=Artemisia annua TaxID=35608 RepID=A0A2U1PC24_ARTAN|nr:hypothetical protein CTI12_AA172740 [Artemisia annua]
MAKYPELAESVAEKRFRRVYLIHSRYTDREKLWEKKAKIAASGPAKKEKPHGKDPELPKSVSEKKFRWVYLIHPRYSNLEKLWEKEQKIVDGGSAKKEKPREQALKDEEEA